jgi:hypothetical protein
VSFPLPQGSATVIAGAPGTGLGNWAGAPGATLGSDGTWVLAYRVREGVTPESAASTVVAVSDDGETFTTVATLDKSRFDAMSMERPSVVQLEDGGWRLYTCCATKNSKHWWIDALDADEPAGFASADARTVLPGDDRTAVKDPIVRRNGSSWEAWICCHPLDIADEEDRMTTMYATSDDGIDWDWHGTVFGPRPGTWYARGARLTAILTDGRAAFDGRATKEENWFERTGLVRRANGAYEQASDVPVSHVRYLEVVPMPAGGFRIFYESPKPDASHDLLTELVA